MDETATSAQYARMKHIYLQMAASVAATFALGTSAACAQQQENTTGDPVELLVEDEGENANWNDEPQTPGTWRYEQSDGGPIAVFVGTTGVDEFLLTCDTGLKQIGLRRPGTSSENLMLRIRTETATRAIGAVQDDGRNPFVTANLDVRDPLLDAMAITKGRFAVEVEGMEPLYLPAWAEVTRIIEDCR